MTIVRARKWNELVLIDDRWSWAGKITVTFYLLSAAQKLVHQSSPLQWLAGPEVGLLRRLWLGRWWGSMVFSHFDRNLQPFSVLAPMNAEQYFQSYHCELCRLLSLARIIFTSLGVSLRKRNDGSNSYSFTQQSHFKLWAWQKIMDGSRLTGAQELNGMGRQMKSFQSPLKQWALALKLCHFNPLAGKPIVLDFTTTECRFKICHQECIH